jgi:hypothetical protein
MLDSESSKREMVNIARRFIGTPFRMWGRDLERGIDCAGIIALPAQQAGFACDELLHRPRVRHSRPLRQALERDMVRIFIAEATIGDILFFCTPPVARNGRRVGAIEHLALVSATNPVTLIQANVYPHRRVVEHLLDDRIVPSRSYRWSQFLKGAYRFSECKTETGFQISRLR